MTNRNSSKEFKTAVIVAVIGLFGVITAAIIGNWDKIFRPAAPSASANLASALPSLPTASPTGMPKASPAVTTAPIPPTVVTISPDRGRNGSGSSRSSGTKQTTIKVDQTTGTTQISSGQSVISISAPDIIIRVGPQHGDLEDFRSFPVGATITVDGHQFRGRQLSPGNFKFPPLRCDSNAGKKEVTVTAWYPKLKSIESKQLIDCKPEIKIDLPRPKEE